jgi:acyl-coenzyme A synthetase/AMP-(fatty) acid ligase
MGEKIMGLQGKNTMDEVNARLQLIIDIHFDSDGGSPYWIEKAKVLGLNARKDILNLADLVLLGPMDEAALAERQIEDFIPRSILHRKEDFIFAETAGTTGKPKFAVHLAEEFHEAFIVPFIKAAHRIHFPQRVNWLFIGPTGPHIIGKAARASARALGSPDVFTVDFDPRWAKKLMQGSFAYNRYLEHIESQAMRVIEIQDISVLFSTPAVLEGLADKITAQKRLKIRGIHLGGMSASSEFMNKLKYSFPNAVVLSGYGNTLFGMMPQLDYNESTGFDYYPHGNRLAVQIVEYNPETDIRNIDRPVDYGQRGKVLIHRLDQVQFIPNMIERDTAVRIMSAEDTTGDGFCLDGIRDPQPIVNENLKPVIGLY